MSAYSLGSSLPRFYPVMPDLNWIEAIVPLGVKMVQLRLKDASSAEIERQICGAMAVCDRHNAQLIVNDYWQEAIRLGADYIHLGQEDLAAADLAAIRAANIKIGISTHSDEELDIALAVEPEYIALGPIYETRLKKMKWAPQGLERIGIWKSRFSQPLVAIGGINLDRAQGVFEAGADSIAVVTDIVTATDRDETVRRWLKV